MTIREAGDAALFLPNGVGTVRGTASYWNRLAIRDAPLVSQIPL